MMGKLTDRRIRSITKPGRYSDGNGLYLEVGRTQGSRSWILRVTVQGKRRDIGLGGYPDVSLAAAREKAREMRSIAKAGDDPLAVRRKARELPTFEEAAQKVYEDLKPGWREGGVHMKHWISSLELHVFPIIGQKRVDTITGEDVLSVLQPIWFKIPETARRVRQRVSAVMAWAKSTGRYEGENPVDTASGALPRNTDAVRRHHPAMPYEDVPGFMRHLEHKQAISALALRFTILTATRSGEARGARWSEIDLDKAVWLIPGSRMKAKRDHRVPLANAALEILEVVRKLDLDPDLVFPGPRPRRSAAEHGQAKPLSDVALSKQVKGYGSERNSVHGFRSSFRDWAAEKTAVPREIAELCLAHEVGSAVERAYARSDLFDKRRDLLERWARFVTEERGVIVELSA